MTMMSLIKRIVLFALVFLSIHVHTNGQKTIGFASYYADKFEGRLTASGEKYYHEKMTAAHPSLPFGSIVKVTHLGNSKTVVVRINDRGPFVEGRIIDLSRSAAQKLDFIQEGIAKVQIELLGNMEEVEKTSGTSAYYEVSSKVANVSGYGVQVASFKSFTNLLKAIHELNESTTERIIVSNPDGTQFYRLIVGEDLSEKGAVRIKEKFRKKYPGAFVISFEK